MCSGNESRTSEGNSIERTRKHCTNKNPWEILYCNQYDVPQASSKHLYEVSIILWKPYALEKSYKWEDAQLAVIADSCAISHTEAAKIASSSIGVDVCCVAHITRRTIVTFLVDTVLSQIMVDPGAHSTSVCRPLLSFRSTSLSAAHSSAERTADHFSAAHGEEQLRSTRVNSILCGG